MGTTNDNRENTSTQVNKYLIMFNTTKYIDVLPQIMSNYNSSYHSGIKKAPNDVDDEKEDVIKVTNRKYNKARNEETNI